jgi:hypothetical protein
MGGFFVTNVPEVESSAMRVFSNTALRPGSRRSVAGVLALQWNKQRADIPEAWHGGENEWIVGTGTFFTHEGFGPECLPKLLDQARRGEWSAFGEVGGHFAFLVCIDSRLHVVSDKTGNYHVYFAQDARGFYLSTSLRAIANVLPRLTLATHEALEFINFEATLGQRTVFEEIQHTDAGAVIRCAPGLPAQRYYEPNDQRVSFEELCERYAAYSRAFRRPELLSSADMSAGHDSRTVAALLRHGGAAFELNTNDNTSDPNDVLIAKRVAEHMRLPLRVYANRSKEFERGKLVAECFDALEFGRNAFRSAYMPVYFREKASDYRLLFGGYGGELLRDKYSRYTSIDELVRTKYVSSRIWLQQKPYRAYRERLAAKFAQIGRTLGETDQKKLVEKIYCFEKMRFWGGARITAASQYCHQIHPLLDHILARHSFDFSLEDKRDASLQRRIIGLVRGLDEIPINPKPQKRQSLVGRATEFLGMAKPSDWSPDAQRWSHRIRTKHRFRVPEALAPTLDTEVSRALSTALSLPLSGVRDADLCGRFATLSYGFEAYRDKLRGL